MKKSFLSRLVLSGEWKFRLSRHILFWFACTIFFTVLYGSQVKQSAAPPLTIYTLAFVQALLFIPVHCFLSYGIIYGLFPAFLYKNKYLKLLLGTLGLLFVTAILNVLFSYVIVTPLLNTLSITTSTNKLFYAFMAGLRGSNTVAGFVAAIKLAKDWYLKNVENQKLEKLRLEAELKSLRAQVHPHFLFNTLNSLYSLALHQSQAAPGAILKLSELLRYMLEGQQQNRVSLKSEIQVINTYLELEQLRFGNRLDLSVHYSGNMEGKTIAPLILLSLVENCFKHGANQLTQPWLSLDLLVKENELHFKLINGKTTEGSQEELLVNHGIGLQNIRNQLALTYPGKHEFRVVQTDDTFLADMYLVLDNPSYTLPYEHAQMLAG